eukprot:5703379-Amphidinium_carterae.2
MEVVVVVVVVVGVVALMRTSLPAVEAEINLFRKKGGHIYTTVTANRTTLKHAHLVSDHLRTKTNGD